MSLLLLKDFPWSQPSHGHGPVPSHRTPGLVMVLLLELEQREHRVNYIEEAVELASAKGFY